MATRVFDGSRDAIRNVSNWVAEGATVVCPKCGAELILALTAEAASKHKVHPGIYCPTNLKHVTTTFELASKEVSALRRK